MCRNNFYVENLQKVIEFIIISIWFPNYLEILKIIKFEILKFTLTILANNWFGRVLIFLFVIIDHFKCDFGT